LFRFSTEEVFPEWLPLPAFAFEVVRRPSATATPQPQQQLQQPHAAVAPAPQEHAHDPPNQQPPVQNDGERGGDRQQREQEDRQSFLRRLLVLAGAVVPLTPEQEAIALEQLVDMFPQYDRSDLLRELRLFGSAERVAESILSGSFSGVARGRNPLGGGVG
jgi:hypothetical protein